MRLPDPARGPTRIAVDGATVSTKMLRVAGVPSTGPPGVRARTWKMCAPSASAPAVDGETHGAGVPASIQHSNAAPAAGSATNSNVGVESVMGPSGPEVIRVSGASGLSDVSVGDSQPWSAG